MPNAGWKIDDQPKTSTAAPGVAGLAHVGGAIPLLILPSPETNLSPTPVTVLAVGNDLLPQLKICLGLLDIAAMKPPSLAPTHTQEIPA